MITATGLTELARALIDDESGATLVEYGLVLMLIAGACIVALTGIGTSLNGIWTHINTEMQPHS